MTLLPVPEELDRAATVRETARFMVTTPVDSTAPTLRDRFDTDEIVGYARSPSDVVRFLLYATIAVVLLVVTRYAQDAVLGFEQDVVSALSFLEPPAERVLDGVAQLLWAVAVLGVIVFPFALRRYRLLGYLIVANILASAFVNAAIQFVDQGEPKRIANELAERAGVHVGSTITATGIATLTASFVLLGPFVGSRWRRAGALLLVTFVAMRIVLSVELPAEVFLALAVGAAVGVATLLAFGRPDQHPSTATVAASLATTGLTVTDLGAITTGRGGSRNFLATLDDGARVLVKVRSPAERSADLLYRLYRWLRLKNVGDERPFISLRRAVEHEALVSLQTRDVGVRTPRLRAIAEVGSDSMLIAFDHLDGETLEALDSAAVDDALLRAVWEQLAVLRAHRIAHRDLRRANIVVDESGAPWLVDFGFSEVAVPEARLDADVAQLLAAVALCAGADRAVDTAIAVLGIEPVRSSLPVLQLNALSGSTRAALQHHKGLMKELQHTVADRCHVDQPQFTTLARLDRRTVLTLVMLVLVVYFLLPQFSNLPGIVDQVKEADWFWFGPVLLMSVVTYIGATFAVLGSVPERIRFAPTFVAQVAASFAGTLAPASVGGLALNARYLQKSGVDGAVAVPAVGLDAIAGVAMHILLLLLFLVWAGTSAFGSIHLPDPTVLLYGAAVVVVLGAIAFAIPAIRHALRDRLVPILKRSISGLFAVVKRPTNILLLLGGSVVVTTGYLTAMYFAVQAFGGDLSFAQVGAVYLVGSAVGSAAPTPGGIGALEAAVIAGLVAAGMPNEIAVPAVFLFRLGTFWLPILPGWGAFRWMQKADYL
ncbi:MAG TPA: lysylphosphatidylglycerol synthase transmembrane domain-containing protein [Acidimicrobiia bacterium]